MILDHYEAYQDLNDLNKYLPMAIGVVEAFRQRFPNKDRKGKMDMWPSQALETYQCKDPTSRSDCPTNPTTDISGLMAVLPRRLSPLPDHGTLKANPNTKLNPNSKSRLISLPDGAAVTESQRVKWKKLLESLPPLQLHPTPTGIYDKNRVDAVQIGPYHMKRSNPNQNPNPNPNPDDNPNSDPNPNPTPNPDPDAMTRSNSENTALYMTHPFRIFGNGKANLSLAQQTYSDRPSPCNDGWCQDIIQAAMLNLTQEASSQLAGRAEAPQAKAFRFEGFAAHNQDYEPSLDQNAFMRTALNYMLLSPVDDEKRSLLLLPTWNATRWNVRFKLHAPLNTTVEASCQNGKLEYLHVTPPSRTQDVHLSTGSDLCQK